MPGLRKPQAITIAGIAVVATTVAVGPPPEARYGPDDACAACHGAIYRRLGSGNHSRGYLYRTPSGELYQLPLMWYTQTGRWGMAPGYDGDCSSGSATC